MEGAVAHRCWQCRRQGSREEDSQDRHHFECSLSAHCRRWQCTPETGVLRTSSPYDLAASCCRHGPPRSTCWRLATLPWAMHPVRSSTRKPTGPSMQDRAAPTLALTTRTVRSGLARQLSSMNVSLRDTKIPISRRPATRARIVILPRAGPIQSIQVSVGRANTARKVLSTSASRLDRVGLVPLRQSCIIVHTNLGGARLQHLLAVLADSRRPMRARPRAGR